LTFPPRFLFLPECTDFLSPHTGKVLYYFSFYNTEAFASFFLSVEPSVPADPIFSHCPSPCLVKLDLAYLVRFPNTFFSKFIQRCDPPVSCGSPRLCSNSPQIHDFLSPPYFLESRFPPNSVWSFSLFSFFRTVLVFFDSLAHLISTTGFCSPLVPLSLWVVPQFFTPFLSPPRLNSQSPCCCLSVLVKSPSQKRYFILSPPSVIIDYSFFSPFFSSG